MPPGRNRNERRQHAARDLTRCCMPFSTRKAAWTGRPRGGRCRPASITARTGWPCSVWAPRSTNCPTANAASWWTGGGGSGRPVAALAVTVNAPTVDAQVEFAGFARSRGASWVILQPPPDRGVPEDFFHPLLRRGGGSRRTARRHPERAGISWRGTDARWRDDAGKKPSQLSHTQRRRTRRSRYARSSKKAGDGVTVFNGRGGLELIDNLRAGCAGMIPASDTFDRRRAYST